MRDRISPSFPDLDLGAPLRTRDGRAVRLLEADSAQPQVMGPYVYPIRAEVEHPNKPEGWVAWSYLRCGHWKSNDSENGNDLVNVPRSAMH
jgi:hypothetical protein